LLLVIGKNIYPCIPVKSRIVQLVIGKSKKHPSVYPCQNPCSAVGNW